MAQTVGTWVASSWSSSTARSTHLPPGLPGLPLWGQCPFLLQRKSQLSLETSLPKRLRCWGSKV
ncbi:unnamed protein product [Nyctereutes procyonoides]|uniref:(raccoon dog) hypothetical protein n=1 Tax=Nyctereutes procyonoides TaxID=34880 RepID=A0A811ZDQ2_NYCPR|nr:unnamed protein product [Nyctereutes procyonoides]